MLCAHIKSWVQRWSSFGTWKGYNRKKDPVESKTRMALGPQVPMSHMKVLQPQYMGYKWKRPKNEGNVGLYRGLCHCRHHVQVWNFQDVLLARKEFCRGKTSPSFFMGGRFSCGLCDVMLWHRSTKKATSLYHIYCNSFPAGILKAEVIHLKESIGWISDSYSWQLLWIEHA